MPERIQLRRTAGWRKPEGAVVVARPSKWGNPYLILPDGDGWMVRGNGKAVMGLDKPFTRAEAAETAVDLYRHSIPPRSIRARDAEIELAGRDLACWCPLDQPCHADVLLEIANGAEQ